MGRQTCTLYKDVTVNTPPKQGSKRQHLKTHENLKKKKKTQNTFNESVKNFHMLNGT